MLPQFLEQPGIDRILVNDLLVAASANSALLMHQQAGSPTGHANHAGIVGSLVDQALHALPAIIERLDPVAPLGDGEAQRLGL